MEVRLTPDQQALVRQAIESGRLAREEDAMKEALSLWERCERRRFEVLVAVNKAEASLALGEGRRITSQADLRQRAQDVKRRGLSRLNSDQNSRA
jgi:Arc/MetJ-type ribon-helix-helix transcriptional regulator